MQCGAAALLHPIKELFEPINKPRKNGQKSFL
jgi:hypothetical protein